MMAERILIFSILTSISAVYAKPMISEMFTEDREIGKSDHGIEETKLKISEILSNPMLNWKRRNQQIDNIYDSLPTELLPQIPIYNEFGQLPKDIFRNIENVYSNDKIRSKERRAEIRRILENITWERRLEMHNDNLPSKPPAGFDKVLGEEIYQKLLNVLQNSEMTVKEKKAQLDNIMSNVPQETIDRLPMPIPSMNNLPDEIQRDAREIMYNFNVPWDERFLQFRQYIRTLPKTYRRLIRFGYLNNSDIMSEQIITV